MQQAINAALAVALPNSSVLCTVAPSGSGSGIRINVLLPQNPDAVVTFSAPAMGGDASHALNLSTGAGAVGNVAHYSLGTTNAFGSQTSSGKGSDGTGLPQTSDIIGDQAAFTGIYALLKTDIFNLLSIPDATRALPSNSGSPDTTINTSAIYSAAITLCQQRRAFLLVDAPPNVSTVAAAVDWISSQLNITVPNGAAFFPRLRLPDPANNYQLRTFAPSGVVAGVYATIDGSRGVWKAPAGIEATLNGVQSMVYKLSDAENGVLNPLRPELLSHVPFLRLGAVGRADAGGGGRSGQSVEVRADSAHRPVPGTEPLQRNTVGGLRAERRAAVGFDSPQRRIVYADLFLKGAFQGSTPDQAYFVKCDSETTTQTDIENGVVNILVGFAPLYPAEFVVIQIEQLTGQATS